MPMSTRTINAYTYRTPYWLRIWFFIPRQIQRYNRAKCKYLYPDWDGGLGTKVRPFLGKIVNVHEGEAIGYQWWKLLKTQDQLRAERALIDLKH